ncbi:MAG: hypothetical protein GC165_17560 [Armatimonadetes bacterium]|nr:hypothetical protein [Armatimonadota bacterium]
MALWKPLSLTGVGATIALAIIFVPRQASAAASERILVAFQNAHYWRQVTSTKSSKQAKWISSSETTYFDGKVQMVSGIPKSRQLTSTIDGVEEYDDFRQLPYIIQTKIDSKYRSSSFENPMDHAMRFLRSLNSFQKRTAKPYRGIEAYELVSKGANAQHGTVVTVSKDSDLPLLIRTVGPTPHDRFEIRQEYFYDLPSPSPNFDPNPAKPIIDIEADRQKTLDHYGQVPVSDEKPLVFDGVLGRNGELWVMLGLKSTSKPGWVPSSKQNGYQVGTSFVMSNYGRRKDNKVGDYEIVAYLFIPTDKQISRPNSVDIKFQLRPMFGRSTADTATAMVPVGLHESQWSFPEFMPAFALQVPVEFVADRFWNIRGHVFMGQGDYRDAAICFENQFDVSVKYQMIPKTNYSNPLEAAATCYDKLGDHARAKSLRKRLAEMTLQKLFDM